MRARAPVCVTARARVVREREVERERANLFSEASSSSPAVRSRGTCLRHGDSVLARCGQRENENSGISFYRVQRNRRREVTSKGKAAAAATERCPSPPPPQEQRSLFGCFTVFQRCNSHLAVEVEAVSLRRMFDVHPNFRRLPGWFKVDVPSWGCFRGGWRYCASVCAR